MPSRPSEVLAQHRETIRKIVSRYRTTNPRVFGSSLDRTDTPESDLDLIVDPLPGATLLDLGGLHADLEEALGVRVDVLTPGDLPRKYRNAVLLKAEPV